MPFINFETGGGPQTHQLRCEAYLQRQLKVLLLGTDKLNDRRCLRAKLPPGHRRRGGSLRQLPVAHRRHAHANLLRQPHCDSVTRSGCQKPL